MNLPRLVGSADAVRGAPPRIRPRGCAWQRFGPEWARCLSVGPCSEAGPCTNNGPEPGRHAHAGNLTPETSR